MIHKLRVSSFTTTVPQLVHRPETGMISGPSAKYTQTLLQKGFKKTKHTHTHTLGETRCFCISQQQPIKADPCVPAGAITKWEWLVWIWLMPVLLLLGVQEKHVPSAQSKGLTQIHTLTHTTHYRARMHTHIGLCLHYWFFSITLCRGLSHTHTGTQTVYISEVQRARQPILKLAS